MGIFFFFKLKKKPLHFNSAVEAAVATDRIAVIALLRLSDVVVDLAIAAALEW